ncbi:MobA/MobL family protein [Microvirga lenta]|uniref:MobA/MobL family protein n=1 Tax=Microvirga lenta TaxID=2881337 RepID=UPI001CFE5214|nr:MobA/MobL family protein [Microvirga lenta]MCB5173922.1 MobA/MobL family protein [Microvirga lenta]
MTGFFRVQLGVVSRSEGHSAVKRSAYQSCGRLVDHEGHRFDYSRKRAEHAMTVMLCPDSTPEWARDPGEVWRRAAAMEKRVDAQEARIIDLSMPRQVPRSLWEACIRHVYEPFSERGMILQIDVHDSPASDGGRNVNVHGLATLRRIEGDGFAKRKERTWNDWLRERDGRIVREMMAERLTTFCRSYGIDYAADARSNAERNRPAPEPELPRWNWEAMKRTGTPTEALAALQHHRHLRKEWEAAKAELDATNTEITVIERSLRSRRGPRINPARAAEKAEARRDRRAAVLRAWHGGAWIEAAAVAEIARARYDEHRGRLWLDLQDGSSLIDTGDAIYLRGPITAAAAMETAAAAERHGWREVEVWGDRAYRDEVTIACLLRGITVTNHHLSPKAQARLDRLVAEKEATSTEKPEGQWAPSAPPASSTEVYRRLREKRREQLDANQPETTGSDVADSSPAYRPRSARVREQHSSNQK